MATTRHKQTTVKAQTDTAATTKTTTANMNQSGPAKTTTTFSQIEGANKSRFGRKVYSRGKIRSTSNASQTQRLQAGREGNTSQPHNWIQELDTNHDCTQNEEKWSGYYNRNEETKN